MNPELCNICSEDHSYLACSQYNPVAGDRPEPVTPSSRRIPKNSPSCRSCLVAKEWWSYDEETKEMMWMMAKRPCKEHPARPLPQRESLLEAAFNDATAAIPPSPPDAIVHSPSSGSTSLPPSSAHKNKRKYRSRCCSSDEILEKYRGIRQRVNAGDSLLTTLRNLNIPYTTFVRTFKPIGEMEMLEPGFINSLQFQRMTVPSLANVCKSSV